MSCPDHPSELTDEMRLTFYDKWGVLKEENETEYLYKELVQKFLNIGDAHANNRLPTVRTTPELSWDINADGLLCPAIEAQCLALVISFSIYFAAAFRTEGRCWGQNTNCAVCLVAHPSIFAA